MALSFHYKGKIKAYEQVDALIAEVTEICNDMGWPHNTWLPASSTGEIPSLQLNLAASYTAQEIKGIAFTPIKCETVFIVFSPAGDLCSPVKLIFNTEELLRNTIETISVKTQYAGVDVHIALMKLLRYLEKKYFTVFELDDEGGYWNNQDEVLLRSQFDRYNFVLKKFSETLATVKLDADETPESLATRLEILLKNMSGSPDQ